MPSQPVSIPASFTPAHALAFTAADGSTQLVSSTSPLPVTGGGGGGGGSTGGLTDAELRATPVPVSGTLTDAQLRAAAVPVTGALTDTQLRAAAVAVTGALTDAQLRASPVPVSGALSDAQLRAAAVAVSGPLTDVQLRASAVPVSGPLTDLQLRATAVPVSGPLTDGDLRASPVPVTGPATDAQLRATPLPVSPDSVVDAVRTSGSATSAATLVSVSTAGFSGGSFHVTSAGTTCTITYEQSNDNTNWVVLPVTLLSSGVGNISTTSNATGVYGFSTAAAFVRARVSTYTSGTVTVSLAQKRLVAPYHGVSLNSGSGQIGAVTLAGTAGVTNVGTGFTDSTTALAASATFTGTGHATTSFSQYANFHAVAFADQAGTLFIDQSLDTGATYQAVMSQAVAANTAVQLTSRVTGAFAAATLYRVRFVNGAAAQTTFRLSSAFSR